MALQTYEDVLGFWFPDGKFQDFWFSDIADHDIKIKFGDLLDKAERGELDSWLDSRESALAYIIVLDQFTRNLTRDGDFRRNDTTAFKAAMDIITSARYTYPINQRIFIYLPLRHRHETPYLDLVMAHIATWQTIDPVELNIIKRFKNATIKDYSKTTDTIRTVTGEHPMFLNVGYVIDDICSKYCGINSGLLSVKTPDTFANVSREITYKTTHNFIRKNFGDSAVMCISLSGGVDSMWISLLLKVMEVNNHISKVVAVHVDYANRKESNDEASFVINWAQFLGIPMCYRRIEHIKRKQSGIDANLYETETKKIRFGLYKYVMDTYNVSGVILGHHRGDIDENIIMNLLRSGHDILGLNGMTDIQNIDGVNICRPLLSHPKLDIYNGAHTYKVPYLKDTTSELCYRGFVRKTLIPSIETKDPAALVSIRDAGKMADEWRCVINEKIFKPMINAVIDYKYGMTIPYNICDADLPFVFWSNYFVTIFHKRNIRMCSVRNTHLFMNWFKRGCNGMLRLSNGMVVFLNTDKKLLYIMKYALIYRVDKSDKVLIPAQSGTDYKINGWHLKVTDADENERAGQVTIENVMNGSYCFYLHQIADVDSLQMTYGKEKDRNLQRYFKGNDMLKFLPKLKVATSNSSHKTYRVDVSFSG
jgi:tRNA(Ile)-lysidine synthetase-like protein